MPRAEQAIGWYDMIEAAKATREVMELSADYLASWPQAELDALPDSCKPPAHFVQPEDVVNYAFEVVRRHCGSHASDDKVARLAGFFGNAARRIAVLMGQRARPMSGNDFKF